MIVASLRTTLFGCVSSCVLSLTSALLGQTGSPPGRDVPEGLSADDWTSIRAVYEAGRHAAFAVDGGYRGHNPGQQFSTHFDGRGFTTTPDSGEWTWGLELVSYGFAGHERAVERPEAVEVEGQRVAYDWGPTLREWYVNDARGLEHGYTVSRRPPRGDEEVPLTFTLAVRGELTTEVGDDGRSVSFRIAMGGCVLTYSGLTVFDATGRILPAGYDRFGERLLLAVDERGARYPLTIDPVVQQASLKASNTDAGARFGWSVAMSRDTVVVGADREASSATGVNGDQNDNSANRAGAAYVFVRNGATWDQEAYLKASNTDANDWFGWSVAVSGDTVVVGAHLEDSNATGVNGDQGDNSFDGSGAAYVFVRNGTTWSQEAYLKASNTDSLDNFGRSVAVSGDTVVVGAYHEDSMATGANGDDSDNSTNNSGAAYVFVRNGTTWSQEAYLKASHTNQSDEFGDSVAVSGDTVLVGADFEDSNATGVNGDDTNNGSNNSGAAYVFVRNGASWSQEAYLKASNTGPGDWFGWSVALSGDIAVVGAFGEDSNATGMNGNQGDDSAPEAGAAYVFVRNGTSWSQEAYLKASNTDGDDRFGHQVSVSADTVVIGAQKESSVATGVNGNQSDNSAPEAGAAYVFVRNGTSWNQEAYLKASNAGMGDRFGDSVAVSGDTVVAGAVSEGSNATGVNGDQSDNSAADSGAAYVFDLDSDVYCDESSNPNNVGDISVSSVSLGGPAITVTATNVPPNINGYLIVGAADNLVANPPGAKGTLCVVGGCQGRYGTDIQSSGSGGTYSTDIKNPATACGMMGSGDYCLPGGCGPSNIQPGDTWYFQYWHRQPMMAPASFTSAIEVTFTN